MFCLDYFLAVNILTVYILPSQSSLTSCFGRISARPPANCSYKRSKQKGRDKQGKKKETAEGRLKFRGEKNKKKREKMDRIIPRINGIKRREGSGIEEKSR